MIGIINVQWYDNPGAVWLAYSLQQTVKKIKPDEKVVIIDYATGGSKTQTSTKLHAIIAKLTGKVENIVFYSVPQNWEYRNKLKLKHQKYESFRSEYLDRTPRTTDQSSAIFDQLYSACIVGSDVVWKPEIVSEVHSKVYFLKFAGNDTKKISYGASIGTDDPAVLGDLKHIYQGLILDFDSISLRESTAVNYIQQLTQKKVYQVLDPVFLFEADAYIQLIKDRKPIYTGKYIYLYMLSYNQKIVSLALKLAREYGCKVIYDLHTRDNMILTKEFKEYGISSIDADPLDFLTLIFNSEAVLCDSFHGTAFSIIFHKLFFTFGRNDDTGLDISTRMRDFLEDLSLMDRYILDEDNIPNDKIDYAAVDRKLNIKRNESYMYLVEALNDV